MRVAHKEEDYSPEQAFLLSICKLQVSNAEDSYRIHDDGPRSAIIIVKLRSTQSDAMNSHPNQILFLVYAQQREHSSPETARSPGEQ